MTTKKPPTPKTTTPTATKPKTTAKPAKPVASEPDVKTAASELPESPKNKKHGKSKVVRDSFSFPEHDYQKIIDLKKLCLAQGIHVKKGELLRAGLLLLTQLNLDDLQTTIDKVEKVKTGRPKS